VPDCDVIARSIRPCDRNAGAHCRSAERHGIRAPRHSQVANRPTAIRFPQFCSGQF
jgi:hypothetical protein